MICVWKDWEQNILNQGDKTTYYLLLSMTCFQISSRYHHITWWQCCQKAHLKARYWVIFTQYHEWLPSKKITKLPWNEKQWSASDIFDIGTKVHLLKRSLKLLQMIFWEISQIYVLDKTGCIAMLSCSLQGELDQYLCWAHVGCLQNYLIDFLIWY